MLAVYHRYLTPRIWWVSAINLKLLMQFHISNSTDKCFSKVCFQLKTTLSGNNLRLKNFQVVAMISTEAVHLAPTSVLPLVSLKRVLVAKGHAAVAAAKGFLA